MKNFTCRSLVSLLLVIPLLFTHVLQASATAQFSGIVSMDVNPSIELTVEDGIVIAASAYNDDGKQLLSGTDVIGLTAEEAVRLMTQQLIEGGFLTSDEHTPYLLITTSGGDAESASALQQTAEQVALELNAIFEIRTGQVSDEITEAAAAAGLTPGKYLLMEYIAKQAGITLEEAVALYGTASVGELADQFGDFDALLEYAGTLTEEQLAVLNAAFEQMKTSIMASEKTYQDAIKALKDRYRVTAQDATKSIKNEDKLDDAIDRLKAEILADYEGIQKGLDGDVAAARALFQAAVDAALIPAEMTEAYLKWHENKEVNAANELTNFIESFKNLSGNGKNDEDKGKDQNEEEQGSGLQSMNGNTEQNQEENENKGDKQNREQETQMEQNHETDIDEDDQDQGRSQGQGSQQSQSQGGSKSGKGKGK
ncbi:MAG TPA: hypothetical protein PKU80_05785 [Candidatus Limiplasma sp.]|mgnify:CR=1 FL=1|nr:hypothetical protein [Candidatus Limiplasma sp.]